MADNLLLPVTLERLIDSNGNVLGAGTVDVFDSGTTAAKNVFTNATLVTAAANPMVADSGGYIPARYIGTGSYKLVVKDSAGVTVKTEDNLPGALDTSSFANDTATPTTPVITKSSAYSVVAGDQGKIILGDSTGGDFTITLLSAVTAGDDFRITIKHIGTSNNVTIDSAAGLIDGASTFVLDSKYESVTLTSDGANWHMTDDARVAALPFPIGMMTPYGGSTAPTQWLLCYGQAISRTTYSALFAIISTTYGVGDGSTTFNVPDIRGRVPAGLDNMGGSSANRLTDPAHGFGLDGDTLGDTGGEQDHTQTTAELVAHTHTGRTQGSGSDVSASTGDLKNNANTGSTGGGTAFNVVQPTIILTYIIFAGA